VIKLLMRGFAILLDGAMRETVGRDDTALELGIFSPSLMHVKAGITVSRSNQCASNYGQGRRSPSTGMISFSVISGAMAVVSHAE